MVSAGPLVVVALRGQVKSGQSGTGQIRPVIPGQGRVPRRGSGLQVGLQLRAPATKIALEDVCVVEEAIEHRADRGGVASTLPQSSTGRLEVSRIDTRS
jgi:hypothetical protein